MCYQMSCHNCLHFAVIFNLWPLRFCFSAGNTDECLAMNPSNVVTVDLSVYFKKLYDIDERLAMKPSNVVTADVSV